MKKPALLIPQPKKMAKVKSYRVPSAFIMVFSTYSKLKRKSYLFRPYLVYLVYWVRGILYLLAVNLHVDMTHTQSKNFFFPWFNFGILPNGKWINSTYSNFFQFTYSKLSCIYNFMRVENWIDSWGQIYPVAIQSGFLKRKGKQNLIKDVFT